MRVIAGRIAIAAVIIGFEYALAFPLQNGVGLLTRALATPILPLADHWLLQWSMARADDPSAIAWLLLAAYAYINEIREAVTNEHERRFQREVARALGAGDLNPA